MWLKSFVPFHTKKPIITREISQQSHYLIDFTEGGRERERKKKRMTLILNFSKKKTHSQIIKIKTKQEKESVKKEIIFCLREFL